MPRESTEPGAAPAAGARLGGAGRPVLVVHRDADVRELLRRHLAGAGYRVVLAEDAVAAVRKVLREPPELIVADENMKYLEGVELLAAAREEGEARRVPVLLLGRPVLAGRVVAAVAEELGRQPPS